MGFYKTDFLVYGCTAEMSIFFLGKLMLLSVSMIKTSPFAQSSESFICNLSFQAEQILKDKASVGLTQRATFLKVNSNISIRVKGTIVIIPDTFLYLKVSNE